MPATRDALNAFLDYPANPVASAEAGPLSGFTLGVKDLFDVEGYITGCGNPDKADEARPATSTASAVAALLAAGARFAGKTQTEELAFSMIGQNVHFPWPVNPAAPDRVSGGSSSGSVAAVAGGLADIAAGSDTNGSIRIPAMFCGLIGLRTTHGRIPLDRTMPLAPSLDTFGWFARDPSLYAAVGDVLFDAFAGEDALGPGTRLRPLRLPALDALLSGPEEQAEYARLAAIVSGNLGGPKDVATLPEAIDDLYWCLRKLQAREAWDIHGAWVTAPGRRIGEAVRDRFLFGRDVTAAEVAVEKARRTRFRSWLGDLLADDGVLVMPTSPCAAPRSDAGAEAFGEFRERAIRMLCWSGLSGFPQVTVPLGVVGGAPFGISLMGPAGSDRALVRLARELLAGRS